jgi:cytochrome b561
MSRSPTSGLEFCTGRHAAAAHVVEWAVATPLESMSPSPAIPSATAPSTTASTWRYGTPAVVLHWLLAALIVFMVGLGWYMMSVEDEPGSESLFDLHKSIGFTVFALIVLRILWRSTHRPEGLPDSVPRWQARASAWLHAGLYLCMIVMPLTGYLGASYQKKGPAFFGLATPRWAAPNHDVAELFFSVHSATAWILVALVVLHVGAGLKHLIVDRDHVFQRMWFAGRASRIR